MDKETLDYFEEYREKKRLIIELTEQKTNAQLRVDKLNASIADLNKEVTAMQGIMTVMIEKGIDPIEAKLSTTAEERSSYWALPTVAGTWTTTGIAGVYPGGAYPGGWTTIANGGYTICPVTTTTTGKI